MELDDALKYSFLQFDPAPRSLFSLILKLYHWSYLGGGNHMWPDAPPTTSFKFNTWLLGHNSTKTQKRRGSCENIWVPLHGQLQAGSDDHRRLVQKNVDTTQVNICTSLTSVTLSSACTPVEGNLSKWFQNWWIIPKQSDPCWPPKCGPKIWPSFFLFSCADILETKDYTFISC